MRHRFGLKLYTTNTHLVKEAKTLVESGLFHYIELYVVPQSYEDCAHIWKNILPCPFVIHAAHFRHGVNLSCREDMESNLKIMREAEQYADALNSPWIIVHGGFGGNTAEVIYQIGQLDDRRFILENIPAVGLNDEPCSSYTAEHLSEALKSDAFGGIVLDIGHAVCMGNSMGVSWHDAVGSINELAPVMYHLSDGEMASVKDVHHHFGHGDFPIKNILKMIPDNAYITLETPKDISVGLKEAKEDAELLLAYYD